MALVDAQGLFGDHVGAQFHGAGDVTPVGAIDSSDNDQLRLGLAHHPVEIRKCGSVRADHRLSDSDAPGVNVTQPDEFNYVTVAIDETLAPSLRAPLARANKHESEPAICFRRQRLPKSA